MAANANSAGGGGGGGSGSSSSLPLFDCPSWAGKPPPGLHLDVVKGDKLIESVKVACQRN